MARPAEVWRIGPSLVSVAFEHEPCRTTLCAMALFCHFDTTVRGRLRLLASGAESGLVAVSGTNDLYLLSPLHAYAGDDEPFATVDGEPLCAALTLSTVALVVRTAHAVHLVVRSAVRGVAPSPRGQVTLPADVVPAALDLLPRASETAVAATAGPDAVLVYRVSRTHTILACRRITVGPALPDATVTAVCLADTAGDVVAAVGDELRVCAGGVTARIQAPKAIGRPMQSIVAMPAGLVVVGPNGVWGICFTMHPKKPMYGKPFVRRCEGRHGATPADDGFGLTVWRDNEPMVLRLGCEGFY